MENKKLGEQVCLIKLLPAEVENPVCAWMLILDFRQLIYKIK